MRGEQDYRLFPPEMNILSGVRELGVILFLINSHSHFGKFPEMYIMNQVYSVDVRQVMFCWFLEGCDFFLL